MKSIRRFVLLLVCSFLVASLPGCVAPGREPVVVLNLLSLQGTPAPIDEVRVIVNGGERESSSNLQGLFVVPLASSGQTLTLGLRFPESFLGQEVFLEVIGLQEGVDVLSGEISLVVDDSGRLNNILVNFCGNETADLLRNEECDDANNVEGDGCDSNYTVSSCGNGVQAPGELCYLPVSALELPEGINLGEEIEIGDVDGDDILDIVYPIPATPFIGIFLGNGDGTFQDMIEISRSGVNGESISAFKLLDLDGDGLQDLVLGGFNEVGILLGNENELFRLHTTLAVEGSVNDIVIGKVDDDDFFDMIVSSDAANQSLFVGNGDGTFQPLSPLIGAISPDDEVLLGDFDGDDITDIVDTNSSSDTLQLSLGSDNGFGGAIPISIGDFPVSATSGDFDLNGKLDIAIARSADVGLLLGIGAGDFTELQTFPVTGTPLGGILTEDFNKDGFLDVAIMLDTVMSILQGNGDGTFRNQLNFDVGVRSSFSSAPFEIGDLNGDSAPDFAVSVPPGGGGISGIGLLLSNP